jgi:hypothetical protein
VLEVYDPRSNIWAQRASMPIAISAYALATFEGRLFVFGGWDGHSYLNTVNIYDPRSDKWSAGTAMPTPRAFAGAAATSGHIYVVGGFAGTEALAVNEEYLPENEGKNVDPWQTRAPPPEGRYRMGIATVAEIIYVVGGLGRSQPMTSLEYLPHRDTWLPFESPIQSAWYDLGLAVIGTHLHGLGGQDGQAPTADHWDYEAIYTLTIPVVQ